MTIKGLTEQRKLTRFGSLRRGHKAKTQAGKTYPKADGYFTPDFEDQELVKLFHEIYGPKPTKVTIGVISNDPKVFFDHHYILWGGTGKLKCKGNGETASRIADGGFEDVECPGPDHCDFAIGSKGKTDCQAQGMLKFFIKGFPGLQYCLIDTKGYHNIVHFNTSFDYLQQGRPGQGIAGVWVEIQIVPEKGKLPDGTPTNFFVIKIVPPATPDKYHELTGLFTPDKSQRQALPSPGHDASPHEDAPIETTAAPVEAPAPHVDHIRDDLAAEIKRLRVEIGLDKMDFAKAIEQKFQRIITELTNEQLGEILTDLQNQSNFMHAEPLLEEVGPSDDDMF